MSQPAALPARPARTMLLAVLASSLLQGSRQARWLRVAVLGVAVLGTLLPASAALAQDADDNGWFQQPAAEPPPEPYYEAPDANAAPAPAQPQDVPDTDPSALTTFRPALDPYGAWVTDSTYGTVWVPNREVVGEDFAPYVSRGHWALTTDDDWIWQSDYPFGWAVFHYGRWVWVSGHGWAWVPGRTYANAWVVWRTPYDGYDYVGWAPMPPTWGWYGGYAFGLWYSPPLPYVFCPSRYVFDYGVHYHIVRDRGLVRDIASHSRVYPTPYHGPANPTAHVAGTGAGGVRPAAIGTSALPRGPAMSAARVPSQAVPAVRTLPSANATQLSGSRITSSNFASQRFRSTSDPQLRSYSTRSPSGARGAFTGESVRRSAPSSSGWSNPRPSSPTWSSYRPSPSPSHVRVAPSSSSSYAPSSHSYAPPSHSYAPVTHSYAPSSHAFAPSFHMHSSGGGGGHRR
ncbi:MAG TPA: DUF6600 domain-containing protein [Polyangiaceae bacterium]|nr:DUF6600 domain-containing protein [Polyangiaceae bacterium]